MNDRNYVYLRALFEDPARMTRGISPTLRVPSECQIVIGAEKEVLRLRKDHLGLQIPIVDVSGAHQHS
eukprot:11533081-Prorocentrum_lima.AAC.1